MAGEKERFGPGTCCGGELITDIAVLHAIAAALGAPINLAPFLHGRVSAGALVFVVVLGIFRLGICPSPEPV